ncbi:MAG: hypothetical protein LBJ73_04550 [Rickettsiales bacterium]|jgi:hypothetical protein|nr:hypothetical protein [Rickettsiales bacterium]
MKRFLTLFILTLFASYAPAAFASCGGDDKTLDPVRNIHAGCGCNGGGTQESHSQGGRVFCKAPETNFCRTKGVDKWTGCETTWCPEWEGQGFNSATMEAVADVGRTCWKWKCRAGYFDTDTNGAISHNKCTPCTGVLDTIQGDTCWHIKCPDDFCEGSLGSECVIYNQKCIPICDLQTAGAVYNNTDSTKLTIKFQVKGAGMLGKTSTTSSE